MKKAIQLNLKLLINRKEFYFSITAMLALILIHTGISIFSQSGRLADYLRTGEYQLILTSGIVDFRYISIFIFPILTIMLFSDSLACEKNENWNKLVFSRINYRKYLITKLVVSFFASLLIIFFVLTLNYAICALIFRSGVYADSFGSSVAYVQQLSGFRYENVQLYTMLTNFKFSMICAFISLTSTILSLYTSKRVIINFSVMATMLISFLLLDLFGLHRFSVINLMLSDNYFDLFQMITVFGIFVLIDIFLIGYKLNKNKMICL